MTTVNFHRLLIGLDTQLEHFYLLMIPFCLFQWRSVPENQIIFIGSKNVFYFWKKWKFCKIYFFLNWNFLQMTNILRIRSEVVSKILRCIFSETKQFFPLSKLIHFSQFFPVKLLCFRELIAKKHILKSWYFWDFWKIFASFPIFI